MSLLEFSCPGCGRVIAAEAGGWAFVHTQVLRHLRGCGKMHELGVADTVLGLVANRITDDLIPIVEDKPVPEDS